MVESKIDQKPLKDALVKIVTTFCYVGEVPYASGTVASLAALLLFLSLDGHPLLGIAVFALLLGAGFFLAGKAEPLFGKKDPRQVVIDEVCGVFIVFFLVRLSLSNILFGFVLYRALDIFKPFPARRLERLPGSLGIMLDDIVCAVYTRILLQVFSQSPFSGVLQF